MKFMIFLTILFVSLSSFSKDVFVNGYHRKDGTYVAPHHRSSPDSSVNNNWSTQGNNNPYNGQQGTRPRENEYGSSYSNGNYGNKQESGFRKNDNYGNDSNDND